MDVLALMKEKESHYTSSQHKVYALIVTDPTIVERYTITKIAALAHTSTSAVLRFTQVLGFDGYKEFRYALSRQLSQTHAASEHENIIDFYKNALDQMHTLDQTNLHQMAEDILHASMVYVTGLHYSSLPARYLVMKLVDLGIPALGAYDTIDMTHQANLFAADSVYIMFSVSGDVHNSRTLYDVLSSTLKQPSWLITCFKKSQYQRVFQHLLTLPSLSSSSYHHVDAHPLMMVFVEMLVDELDRLLKEGA